MATTRFLKLRIPASADNDTKYNLNKIDELASTFQVNSNGVSTIRSQLGIIFQPNSSDVGGTGAGGTVLFGSAEQPLANLSFNANSVNFTGSAGLFDTSVGGTKSLFLRYKSDQSGLVETTADRVMTMDLNGFDRQFTLGGNFELIGGNLLINLSGLTNNQVLAYNSGTGKWSNVDQTASNSGSEVAATWLPGDGSSKTITHGFNSYNMSIQVINESQQSIEVDTVTRNTLNQVTLDSTQAPSGDWTVLIRKIG